jgi:hypothetical protein
MGAGENSAPGEFQFQRLRLRCDPCIPAQALHLEFVSWCPVLQFEPARFLPVFLDEACNWGIRFLCPSCFATNLGVFGSSRWRSTRGFPLI